MAALPTSTQGMTSEEKKKLAWNAALAGLSLIPGGVAVSGAARAAQAGTQAIPWLMRARRGLTAGKGLSIPGLKKFYGVPKATAPALKRTYERYPKGTVVRDASGKPYGMGGKFTGKYDQTPSQAGLLRRRPITSALLGTGAAMGTYPLAHQLMGGEEPVVQGISSEDATQEPWSAPPDMLNFAEQQEALAAEGKEQLSRMLQYGFGLAAVGAKTDKFFDRGMAILEQSKAYKESKHFADVVRAVYKEGDMPKNAREAYERLTPLVGPEQASVLSGHQLGMEKGKTKEERIWNDILETAQYGDIEGAAAKLVAAWSTGRLRNAPLVTNYDMRLAKAKQLISGAMSGPQFAEGVQGLEVVDA